MLSIACACGVWSIESDSLIGDLPALAGIPSMTSLASRTTSGLSAEAFVASSRLMRSARSGLKSARTRLTGRRSCWSLLVDAFVELFKRQVETWTCWRCLIIQRKNVSCRTTNKTRPIVTRDSRPCRIWHKCILECNYLHTYKVKWIAYNHRSEFCGECKCDGAKLSRLADRCSYAFRVNVLGRADNVNKFVWYSLIQRHEHDTHI